MGRDANDILNEEGEDALRANIEAAEPRRRRKTAANGAAHLPALPMAFASSWYGLAVPPREWIVPNLVPARAVTLVTGHGGAGKSTLIMQLQAAMGADGATWLGRDVMHAPSLGLYSEDEETELQRRMGSICTSMGVDLSELMDTALISTAAMDEQMLAVVGDDNRMVATALFDALVALCLEIGVRLVIIDGAADVFGGNENDRGQVRAFLGMLRRLAIAINGGVVLIAHPSRAGLRDDSGTSGSTHWHNAARSLLYFTRPTFDDADGEAWSPDLRELRQLKNQFGPLTDPIHMKWDDGAMVVQERPGGIVGAIEDSLAERKFLEALDRVMAQGRFASESKNSPNYAPKLLQEVMDPKVSVKSLERAMKSLFRAGTIHVGSVMKPNRQKVAAVIRVEAGQKPNAGPLFDGGD